MNLFDLRLRLAQLDESSLRQIEDKLGGIDPKRVLTDGDPGLVLKLASIIEKDYALKSSISFGAPIPPQPHVKLSPRKSPKIYVHQPKLPTHRRMDGGAAQNTAATSTSVNRRSFAPLPRRPNVIAGRAFSTVPTPESDAQLTNALKKARQARAAAKAHKNDPGDEVQWVAPPGVRVVDVYTDGSVRQGRAGYGIHWPEKWHGMRDVRARLSGTRQVSQRAELMAIIEALRMCKDKRSFQLRVHTDCHYCIWTSHQGQHVYRARSWRDKKKRKAEEAQLPNRDLIERLEYEQQQFTHRPVLQYVKGHSGVPGNEVADRLAGEATRLPDIPRERWVDQDAPPTFNDEVVLVSSSRSKPLQDGGFTIVDVVRSTKRAKVQ